MKTYASKLQGTPLPLCYYMSSEGTDIAEVLVDGMTVFEACEKGAFPTVAAFLMSGVAPGHTERDSRRATLAHYASKGDQAVILQFLFDNGADLNSSTTQGQTPLMWALEHGKVMAAKTLLRLGVNVLMTDQEGHSCISFGIQHPSALFALSAAGVPLADAVKRENLLHVACQRSGNRIPALFLIEQCAADVNAQDALRKTPLHYAVLTKDIDLVKSLCASGADSEIVDTRGFTAITEPKCPSHIKSWVQSFTKEINRTKRDRMALPDYSNYAQLNVKQIKHFLIAFFVPNTIITVGCYLPTLLGFLCLILSAVGFVTVANFGMSQKGRSLSTAGWFSGALIFGSVVLTQKAFPAVYEYDPDTLIPAVWCVVTALMFFAYLRAVLADPGAVQSTPESRKLTYEAILSDRDVDLFDTTTMVQKPLRSKHCSKTHQCVHRFDHFCVWTGNAIGGGNHRSFVVYCLCQVISQSCVTWCTIISLYQSKDVDIGFSLCKLGDWLLSENNTMISFFLVFYNSFVFLFVLAVLFGQLWYATRNVTSNEVWFTDRYRWMFKLGSRSYSMYDQGMLKNLIEFFWTANHCLEAFTVPPMNEHLISLTKKYTAKFKVAQQGPSPPALSSSDPPAAGAVQAAQLQEAIAQLPSDKQADFNAVQNMLNQLIRSPHAELIVPESIAVDRRALLVQQAQKLFQTYQQRMAEIKSQGPNSPTASSATSQPATTTAVPLARKQA